MAVKWASRAAASQNPLVKRAVLATTPQQEDARPGEVVLDPAIAACEQALRKGLDGEQERNVRERLRLLRECEFNPSRQEEERRRCAASPAYFAKWYCWGFDPRKKTGSRYEPFIPWRKQVEYLRFLPELRASGGEAAIPKTRGAGATFLSILYAVNRFLFEDDFVAGFGSAKKELVDNGEDPKTIFFKVRVILYRLPSWMVPVAFQRRRHDVAMRLSNPQNGSSLIGESGDNIGRGGRTSIYFVDEAAFVARAALAERSLSENTDVRVWISTPNGVGNLFWQKVHKAGARLFRFAWRDDPRKNQYRVLDPLGNVVAEGHGYGPTNLQPGYRIVWPWYEGKKAELSDVALAQEYDIDFAASLEGVLIQARMLESCIGLRLGVSGLRKIGYDIAEQGENESAMALRVGPTVLRIERWRKLSTAKGATKAIGIALRFGAEWFFYDRGGGYGSTVASALETASDDGSFGGLPFSMEARGVNGGGKASGQVWPGDLRAHQKFKNKRTELFFKLAERVRKTHEYVTEGIAYDPEELLSLPKDDPNLMDLIAQLTMLTVEELPDGRAMLVSKKKMQKDGIPSPDLADALAYSEEDPPLVSPAASFSL